MCPSPHTQGESSINQPLPPQLLTSESWHVCVACHLEDAFCVLHQANSYSAFKTHLRHLHPDSLPPLCLRPYLRGPAGPVLSPAEHFPPGLWSEFLCHRRSCLSHHDLAWLGPQLVLNQGSVQNTSEHLLSFTLGQAWCEGFSIHNHLGCGTVLLLETPRGRGRWH